MPKRTIGTCRFCCLGNEIAYVSATLLAFTCELRGYTDPRYEAKYFCFKPQEDVIVKYQYVYSNCEIEYELVHVTNAIHGYRGRTKVYAVEDFVVNRSETYDTDGVMYVPLHPSETTPTQHDGFNILLKKPDWSNLPASPWKVDIYPYLDFDESNTPSCMATFNPGLVGEAYNYALFEAIPSFSCGIYVPPRENSNKDGIWK